MHDKSTSSSMAQTLVDRAIQRLESAAYVGLKEHWNASICLFHR